MKRTHSSVIVNNSPSSRRLFTFHFFFFDSHFGKRWKDNSFSLDDFEWQRGTQQWLTIADPSHLSLFQDGGHIASVTSARAACKRSITISNHKNYNFLACDWFKNVLFSTNSLAKLLSDSLLLESLLSDSLISQSHSEM